jgi:hypothetical protein
VLKQASFHKDVSGSGDKLQLHEFLNLAPDRGESLAACSGFFMVGKELPVSIGVTVHFGPCEEDGSSVWEQEFYSGQHLTSKRTWDIGVGKIIKGRETRPLRWPWEGICYIMLYRSIMFVKLYY